MGQLFATADQHSIAGSPQGPSSAQPPAASAKRTINRRILVGYSNGRAAPASMRLSYIAWRDYDITIRARRPPKRNRRAPRRWRRSRAARDTLYPRGVVYFPTGRGQLGVAGALAKYLRYRGAGRVASSSAASQRSASSRVSRHISSLGWSPPQQAGRSGRPNNAQRVSEVRWMQRTPAGLPPAIPNIVVIDGAMQHAPHSRRHARRASTGKR